MEKIVTIIENTEPENVFETAKNLLENKVWCFEIQSTDNKILLGVNCFEDICWGKYTEATVWKEPSLWSKYNDENKDLFDEFDAMYGELAGDEGNEE